MDRSVQVFGYAKINLHLDITGRRADGYHTVNTVMQTVSLCDEVTITLREDEKIFAYTRDTETEHLLVVCNFTDETLAFDAPEAFRGAEMLISNYGTEDDALRPYEAAILYYRDNA